MSVKAIGFAGLGVMGRPMATQLVKAGHPLVVHDVDAAKAKQFAAEHAGEHSVQSADSLEALGRSVDILFLMLPTGRIVRELLLEEQGGALARGLKPGSIVVDMSSSEPGGTQSLGKELKDRGIVLMDAPVSGGPAGAEAGALTIMLGTDDEAAARAADPLLHAMGKNVFRTGILGSGHATKALNNFLLAVGYCAASEAVILGKKFGLDPALLMDVVNVSSGRSYATDIPIRKHVLSGKFASGFRMALMTKDVAIAAGMATEADKAMPVGELVLSLLQAAEKAYGSDSDYSRVYHYLDELERPGGKV